MSVNIGTVQTFPDAHADKEQALKVLEEASEVYNAWQIMAHWDDDATIEPFRACLVDECADVITATCNLLAALGVDDLTAALRWCEKRNRERGRC